MKNLLAPITSTGTGLISKIKIKSPEIFIGIGVISIGVGFVLTIRNTLKCKDEVTTHQDKIEEFKESHTEEEEGYNREITKLYMQKTFIYVKNYAGPVSLIVGGICAILYSHHILSNRNAALIAAYGALDEAYKRYRARVADEVGEEREMDLYLGRQSTKKIDSIEQDEEGNEKKVEVKNGMVVSDPSDISQYARIFDESSSQWTKSSEYNKTFLITTQSMLNDRLKARGHLFLNEVYDALGFERTQAGNVVGWVMGNGDDYVDFGIYDIYKNPRRADFINGYERSILLDFNVDGVILNKI